MLEENQIHCGDAFTLLTQVDDGSVDLIICDGPFGVTNNDWDRIGNIQQFNLKLIHIISKKLKDGGALRTPKQGSFEHHSKTREAH